MYACAALPTTIPPGTVGGGSILVIWRVRVPKSFWEGLGRRFGGSRVCVCGGGGLGARVRLGSFLGALGHLFGCLGRFLGSSWAPPRLSWAPPGRSCAPFGLSCSVLGRLGAVLGGVGAILGRLGAILGCLVAVLGRLQTIGAQAKQARQATQSKTSIGGRWEGGYGRGESWKLPLILTAWSPKRGLEEK